MDKRTWNMNLYLLNFALLFTHEIDSAYWKEWELFRIPGGIQVFLVLNSLFLAASGVFAFFIHSYFILNGRCEFTMSASMVLLVLILIVSLEQGLIALDEMYAKQQYG